MAFRERIPLFTHIPLLRVQQKKWHSGKESTFLHTSLSWGLNRKSGIQGKSLSLFTRIPLLRAQQKVAFRKRIPLFYIHPSLEGSTEKVEFRKRIPLFHLSLSWGLSRKAALRERIPLFTHIHLLRAQQKKYRSGKESLFLLASLYHWGLNRKTGIQVERVSGLSWLHFFSWLRLDQPESAYCQNLSNINNGLRGRQVLMFPKTTESADCYTNFTVFYSYTVYSTCTRIEHSSLCGSSQNVDHKRLNFREENFDCWSWDQIFLYCAVE